MATCNSPDESGAAAQVSELDDRSVAALTEVMTVLDDVGAVRNAPNLYLVVSSSGSSYLVDTRLGACDCPDDTHRPDIVCKHRRRVAFVTGERPIPDCIEPAAVDDQFGLHVASDPVRVATDGGITEVSTGTRGAGSNADPLGIQAGDEPRTKRAKREEMDIAFLRQVGVYEVFAVSNNVYEVDVIEETCSCPDGAKRCKHLRRVDIEIHAGRVPRPDGRLPGT